MKTPPVERYAEGLAAIDAGAGPPWAKDLAAAIRSGEMPIHFADRTGHGRSRAYEILQDPYGVKVARRKGTYRCQRCGAEKRHDGSRRHPVHCLTCARQITTEQARERIIKAIRTWAEMFGSPPGAADWSPPMWRKFSPERIALNEERWQARKWPYQTSVVQGVFGSWNAAIRAAGFDPIKPGHRRNPEAWRRAVLKGTNMARTPEQVLDREIEKSEKMIERAEATVTSERDRIAKLRKARAALEAE